MKKLTILLLAAASVLPASAVTDKEMDEARAIAAKHYLRWTNPGSGYLDDVHPGSMAELNAALKSKEKENIKAFNSVRVPAAAEYASWTKDDLVKYWSETFFSSTALSEDGKRGRSRAGKEIRNMKVAPPQPKSETPAAAPEAAAAQTPAPDTTAMEAIDTAVTAQQDIMLDQNAIQEDAANAANSAARAPEQSHTWVYIVVLAILVGIVIWLVVYAANLMKHQPGASVPDDDSADNGELREQTRKAIARKNEEVEDLRRRLQTEESRSAELGMEIEKLKLERKRMEDSLTRMREENAQLRNSSAQAVQAPVREARPEPAREKTPVRERTAQAPERPEPVAQADTKKPMLKVIYLGRANARGIFVRADRRINPGNTIYRLDTNDGLVGTFHVVDEPEVVDVALSNPNDYLSHGCTADDLEDTAGVTRILTESAGTAIMENGYWKILRKSHIRYE